MTCELSRALDNYITVFGIKIGFLKFEKGTFIMQKILVGIIGGSGLYNMEALQNATEHHIDTPFGKPSDVVVTGS